jgi:AraC-like DNA-binding protein
MRAPRAGVRLAVGPPVRAAARTSGSGDWISIEGAGGLRSTAAPGERMSTGKNSDSWARRRRPTGSCKILELTRREGFPGLEATSLAFLGGSHVHLPTRHVFLALTSGTVEIQYRGRTYSARVGQTVAFAPGDPFVISAVDALPLGEALYVPRSLLEEGCHAAVRKAYFSCDARLLADEPRVVADFHLFTRRLASFEQGSLPSRLMSCLDGLLEAHSCPGGPPLAPREPAAVSRVRRMLHDPRHERFNLDLLASEVGISKFHLVRMFRDATGLPPLLYWQALRIERARDMLSRGVSITVTASELQFADQSHLGRAFLAHVGTTPKKYQRGLSGSSPRGSSGVAATAAPSARLEQGALEPPPASLSVSDLSGLRASLCDAIQQAGELSTIGAEVLDGEALAPLRSQVLALTRGAEALVWSLLSCLDEHERSTPFAAPGGAPRPAPGDELQGGAEAMEQLVDLAFVCSLTLRRRASEIRAIGLEQKWSLIATGEGTAREVIAALVALEGALCNVLGVPSVSSQFVSQHDRSRLLGQARLGLHRALMGLARGELEMCARFAGALDEIVALTRRAEYPLLAVEERRQLRALEHRLRRRHPADGAATCPGGDRCAEGESERLWRDLLDFSSQMQIGGHRAEPPVGRRRPLVEIAADLSERARDEQEDGEPPSQLSPVRAGDPGALVMPTLPVWEAAFARFRRRFSSGEK